jgi:hypothetical protein
MPPDQQEQINILCARIATEQDQDKFVRLVQELNDLLDRKNDRKSLDCKDLNRKNSDGKNSDRKNKRLDPPASPPGSGSGF